MGYSRWTLVDLHVHTPADKKQEYGDVGGREPNAEFAERLLVAHASAGVKAFAVTDHNRVDWWPVLAEAGKTHGVTVFPGLEVNVNKCHLIVIWDCTTDGYDMAQQFLASRFKGGAPRFNAAGEPNPIESGSPLDVARDAIEHRGLVLAPHSTAKQIGLFGKNVCNVSAQVAQSSLVTGFDVVGAPTADVLSNPRSEFGDEIPVWFISGDVRSLESVGKRAVYLKMSERPTLESIRQAFLMPRTRIRFQEAHRAQWGHVKHVEFMDDPAPDWPHLRRIQIHGGFHDGLEVELGPGLNAVIGGKGTGKSTLVEIIRYVCETSKSIAVPSTAKEGLSNREANFSANAEADIEYLDEALESYEVHRVGGSSGARLSHGGSVLEVEVPRRVRLRVFGQRELSELHKQPHALREFVASQTGEDGQRALTRIKSALDACRRFDREMGGLEAQLERVQDDRQQLSDLDERLKRLAERGAEALVRESELLGEADRAIGGLVEWPERLSETAGDFEEAAVPPDLPSHVLILQSLVEARESAAALAASESLRLKATLTAVTEQIASAVSQWPELHRVAREDVDRRLADTGLANTEELAAIQLRVAQLREALAGTPEMQTKLDELQVGRADAITELAAARRDLSRLVESAARSLNEKTGSRVRLTVEPLADRSRLVEFLSKVAGRKLTDDQTRRVGMSSPQDIRDAANGGKAALLEIGISTGLADHIVAMSRTELRGLEEVDTPDLVGVQVDLGEGGDARWTEIADVSPGQAATAMLSIALVGGEEPLVIDQPEDDLDNRFVYEEVVQLLADVSAHRQVVVATHNANIPVLGDAELIVAFDATSGRAYPIACGGLDEPGVADTARSILEGGDEAFRRRARRYNPS